MEGKKTIKNIIILLICLSALALISINIYNHQQNSKIPQNRNHGASASDELTGNAISGEENAVYGENTQSSTGTGRIKFSDSTDVGVVNNEDDAAEDDIEMFLNKYSYVFQTSEADRTSEMRDLFYAENYDLFMELNLSPEEEEKLLDILLSKTNVFSIVNERLKDEIPSKEEFKQVYEDVENKYDMKAGQLLDTNDYEKYQKYVEASFERHEVYSFVDRVILNDSLTENQIHDLINAMHEELNESGLELIDMGYELLYSFFNDQEGRDRTMDYLDRIHEAYINASKNILSPSQIEQFEAFLKSERDSYEPDVPEDSAQTME